MVSRIGTVANIKSIKTGEISKFLGNRGKEEVKRNKKTNGRARGRMSMVIMNKYNVISRTF